MAEGKKLFKVVAALYANENNPEWKSLSYRSKTIYRQGLIYIGRFNNIPVDEITRPMVIQYRDDTFDTPAKCRIGLTVLNNVLRYAHDRGMVEYNQAAGVKGLPKKEDIQPWTEDEFDRFVATAPDHLRLAAYMALYTGQRRSDLVKMRWSDYDGQTIRVVQRKTGSVLRIPVHHRLKALVSGRKERSPFILVNAFGGAWTADSLGKAFKRHLNAASIPDRSIHGLRKSAATALAEAGCSPHQIAAITGHRSLRNVELYTKAAQQVKLAEQAMESWK